LTFERLALAVMGPYPISEASERVETETIGVYVLSDDGKRATYVGRSDYNLRQRIIDSAVGGSYVSFWFDYATSPMVAYKYECLLYHKFQPEANETHPAVPENTISRCLVEGCEWN
jgi:hypothetical protein